MERKGDWLGRRVLSGGSKGGGTAGGPGVDAQQGEHHELRDEAL